MYNSTMKKRKTPLGKVANATRKAHSKALFESMLLTKHTIVIPSNRKGSRMANKTKAIRESY